ncbi:hypothetical protein [Providencia sneebia]|uniref:AsmA domain-containing protein n=1 Tax=Providencia sneebia DSM 19967 TaxID=1141660 RepID=K8WKA4_9GAMM|nr:hypothetical protein [Providencia sneebia]EKT60984.1 hypothetical protein OO7_02816 [Providencia sneebia DSM 19967]
MRWLTRLIITLLILFLFVIIFTYISLQTRWGASYASQFLSKLTSYNIDVGIMGHEFANPGEFIFQDIKLSSANNDISVDAKQIVVEMSWRKLFSGNAIHRLVITQGDVALNSSETSTSIPLDAHILQFENSRIQLNQNNNQIEAVGLTGGITPWHPTVNHPFGYGDFRFTSNQLNINELPLKNVAITGKRQENMLVFNEASGYLNNGYILGSGKMLADKSIVIDSLAMNRVGWQTSISFADLLKVIEIEHPISIKNLILTNIGLQGKDWAVSGLNTEIDQLGFVRGSWNLPKSHIDFNIDQLVIGDQQVDTLIGKANIQGDNLNIEKLSGYYYKGVFNLNATWQRNDKTLTINEGKLAGILYTLPNTWLDFFAQPAPNWLSGFKIQQFTLSQSLLMNIESYFPFEFTALSGNIEDINFIKQKQWGIWSGKASFNADSGTINQVMVRRPYMDVRQSGQASAAASLTASTEKGIVKVGLLVKQSPQKVPFLLRASGTNVDLSVLNQWGWQGFPPQLMGDFDTTLQGDLLAPKLTKTLNGELMAMPLQGKRMFRTVVNGVVTSSVESEMAPVESETMPLEPPVPSHQQIPAIVTQ